MHVGGREDDDEGDAGAVPSNAAETQRQAELAIATDFVRDVAGRVALDLATTPEGRAAGLSVDVWPTRGVSLRVRSGHELRVLVEMRGDEVWVVWERTDPSPRGRPRSSQGDLGRADTVTVETIQAYLAGWLSHRVGG